jgi:hypothetical protein
MSVLNMRPAAQQSRLARHQRECRICKHPQREEIKEDFVSWTAPVKLAKQYRVNERALYRHAHALGLFPKRDRNIRAALSQIIEKAGRVRVTGPTIVAAIAVLSKINANGQWIDRRETVSLNSLFDKMSQRELERYARDGTLPQWFENTVRVKQLQAPEA